MCLPEVQKMLWSTGGKERGKTSGEGEDAERATFHEGLEHFVTYYVFTKRKKRGEVRGLTSFLFVFLCFFS